MVREAPSLLSATTLSVEHIIPTGIHNLAGQRQGNA